MTCRKFLDSVFRIEAAIVRIMKARKRLAHNSLVNEVSFIDIKNFSESYSFIGKQMVVSPEFSILCEGETTICLPIKGEDWDRVTDISFCFCFIL